MFLNFATPLVFYIAYYLYGSKAAIGFAVLSIFVQSFFNGIYRLKISPFFLVASVFTVGFGSIDLMIQNPTFYRFEPFAQNFLIASLFLFTFWARFPLFNYLAESLPKKIRPNLSNRVPAYFRKLTLIWAVYLYFKAAVFFYLAFRVDLGKLILLRSLIGGGTLLIMVLGEFFYRKYGYKD